MFLKIIKTGGMFIYKFLIYPSLLYQNIRYAVKKR